MTDPIPFYEAPQVFDPAIPLGRLTEHPANYNEADEGKLAQLLDAHGLYGGIIVQKSTGLIVVGNHRYRVAKDKGAETIPGFWLDVDDDEAEEILASDNLSSKLAVFNEGKLIELLNRRSESPRGLGGSGYTEANLAALLRRQQAQTVKPTDPVDDWEGMPDFDQPGAKPAYSVVIHFPSEAAAEAFFLLIERDRPAAKYMWWPKHDGHKGVDYSVLEVQEQAGE